MDGRITRWAARPVRIALPLAAALPRRPDRTELAVPPSVSRVAGRLGVLLPATLVIAGLVLAGVGAWGAQRESTEAPGTLALEVGAVMWFGGAVALGARAAPTVLRVVVLGLTAVGGAALVTAALTFGWDGAALDLAMEFGVGLVAVALLDVVLLGVVHRNLEALAANGAVVEIALARSWKLVDVRVVGPASP